MYIDETAKEKFSNQTEKRKELYKDYKWYSDFSSESIYVGRNYKKKIEKRLNNYKNFIYDIRKKKLKLMKN
jgi:hypothetical protein